MLRTGDLDWNECRFRLLGAGRYGSVCVYGAADGLPFNGKFRYVDVEFPALFSLSLNDVRSIPIDLAAAVRLPLKRISAATASSANSLEGTLP